MNNTKVDNGSKHKLVKVGANILSSGYGNKKFASYKSSSLNWEIEDKETRDFYQ